MLFILDSSLINLDLECVHQNRALETLLGSFQNRSHLLYCPMEDLAPIREKLKGYISWSSKIILNTLYNRSVEHKMLVDSIEYKSIVYIEDDVRQGMYKAANTWFVPLRFFADLGLVQTSLLCENEIDAELYLLFAELYMRKRKIKGFLTSARLRGGGGSGTAKALASYVRSEHSPCLCITDSDKLYPAYRQSASSRHCDNVAKISKVVKHLTITERELENLIPKELLRKISDVDGFTNSLKVALEKNSNLWNFIDVKNGIKLSWIHAQDAPTQKYWKPVSEIMEKRRKICSFCDYPKSPSEECSCGSLPGLGDSLLHNSVKFISSNEPKINLRLLETDQRWEDLGKVVFDFSLAFGGELVAS